MHLYFVWYLRFGQFVAFRMHPGAVKWILYLAANAEGFDANEAGTLHIGLLANAAHRQQILARLKRTILCAMLNDLLGLLLGQTCNVSKQRMISLMEDFFG